ncbi:MAG: undecaprenyl-phosphate glucose phosphotransferase [Kiritimatiellae bacterium]|jgi:exopolysaccharide biosynthesis polyprenyl glycosylphosphotransferase|nr:undecaprenyl-phosphate glucose phosphotransferase [Kiritimatiellia bacterium]
MQSRQTSEHLLSSLLAVTADTLAVCLGLQLSMWLRFHSGLFAIDQTKGIPTPSDRFRLVMIATVVFILVFQNLKLFHRPHQGRFEDTIPRLLRAILISFVLYFALEAALRLEPEFSRLALVLALGTVTFLVTLERYLLYRIELHRARHAPIDNRVLVVGTDPEMRKLAAGIERDKFQRSRIVGFIRARSDQDWPDPIPANLRLGNLDQVLLILKEHNVSHLVLSDRDISPEERMNLVKYCEQHYISFHLVPDLFRMLTSDLQVRHIDGVPVMGLGQWPLDRVGPRFIKRSFDIVFSLGALLLVSPLLLLAALAIKATSKGPVFYRQTRCGKMGSTFEMIKLRTMQADAESAGPGWTTPDDPRRTPVGGFLRKWNIDELPQFWNVLIGEMSVVGPRPERPVYVEQFKEEIQKYMRRHVHKPGITGWAQVHGLRGDTSIGERIKLDLFYLENWSPGLDLKIVLKTLLTHENAY